MSKRDSLTDWFHALAEHPADALAGLATSENIALLQLHVSRSTPDYPLPETIEATEFAETVITFRKNESAWNHAVMAALIKADELFKAGSISEAAETLFAFAASCPWSLFKEVALNQATHYR
jgi:hypothetical protein